MFCPRCGDQMADRDGTLTCDRGDMPLSPKLQELLTETFVLKARSWDVKPAQFRWGGEWFCPADGAHMDEHDGVVRCPACSEAFPGPLLHQLIELHPHLSAPPRAVFVNVNRPRSDGPYECPCCGYITLPERGGFDICEVCFWEDDGQDDRDADEVRGGPNGDLSLVEARQNFRRIGASSKSALPHVRRPREGERPSA